MGTTINTAPHIKCTEGGRGGNIRPSTNGRANYITLWKEKRKKTLTHPILPTQCFTCYTNGNLGDVNLVQLPSIRSEPFRYNSEGKGQQTYLNVYNCFCYKNHKATIFQQSHLPDSLKASTLRELTKCAAEAQSPSNELFGSNVYVNNFSDNECEVGWKRSRKERSSKKPGGFRVSSNFFSSLLPYLFQALPPAASFKVIQSFKNNTPWTNLWGNAKNKKIVVRLHSL